MFYRYVRLERYVRQCVGVPRIADLAEMIYQQSAAWALRRPGVLTAREKRPGSCPIPVPSAKNGLYCPDCRAPCAKIGYTVVPSNFFGVRKLSVMAGEGRDPLMAVWDSAEQGAQPPHSHPWLAEAIFALDARLRRHQAVLEYTQHPSCIFRLQIDRSGRPLALCDGTHLRPG